jgi:hypothetical protein
MDSKSVSDALAAMAAELTALLLASDESVAAQIAQLKLVDRCRCGDSFCATFYTAPRPNLGADLSMQENGMSCYGPNHRNVLLVPPRGLIILDIVEQRIMWVEVLYREDIRTALEAVLS